MKLLTKEDLEHVGSSLITIKGTGHCLGDLLHLQGRGTFCPSNGRVPVSKKEADVHNKAFDKAKLEGLDKRCKIGQHGMFYYSNGKVTTFLGTQVNEGRIVSSGEQRKTIYFSRKGMKFKAILRKDNELINAVRTK